MDYQVGDQPIPGYRLEAFLGAGSYGEVWRAGGPGGVACALKFIRMDSKSGLKEFSSIRLVKKLHHPNLCPIQAIWLRDPDGNVLSDTGDDSISIRLMGPKELVIAMGLGQKSLAQRLDEARAKGGIPARDLLRYVTDAAEGIDYLNSPERDPDEGPANIIHCDIKPANLLIVGGRVQVCDYGVAKALRKAGDAKMTAAGTPAYAPPELLSNEPCRQTDQYSLAITYYELRTGRLPFDETRAIIAHVTNQLDFSGVNPDEQLVLKQATHKQPGKRFESCEEFIDALKVAANITLGPSGVVKVPESRPLPPPEPPPIRPMPQPSGARLGDLLRPGGELVPDHFLTRLLGRGGYGEVWEAQASGGVRCALKVVRDLQGRGKHEFAVLDTISKLDHHGLVQLRGYWLLTSDGTRVSSHQVGLAGVPAPSAVVISTDLAEKNLLDRLQECRLDGLPGIPTDELIGHVRQAAVALDYLNLKHSIQHRDVKPENLLLRGDRLLVSDFGLAKLLEGDGGAVQSSSSGMTLEYAAPELLQKKVSSRTDQYSLALTYYTLRTGRMPFPSGMGQFDTMQARIKGQLELSGVPEAEQAVLRKALAPNPADRFGSCEELARQLAYASGVGTGQMMALDGDGRSRITPTDLSPRMTPVSRPDRSAASRSTPGGPQETPRASARPGEVSLSRVDGTIMFNESLTGAGATDDQPSSAPWAEEKAPVRKTKSGQRNWTEDAPTGGGGGGRTAAVIGGVVVLLALAGVGAVALIDWNGTKPTGPGPGIIVTQADQLAADAEKLIGEEKFDEARKKITELGSIDTGRAGQLRTKLDEADKRKHEREAEEQNRVADLADQIKQKLSTNQLTEARDMLAKLEKMRPGASADLRPQFEQRWKARVGKLVKEIRELSPEDREKNQSRFDELHGQLAALEPDKAAEERKWWHTPVKKAPPPADDRVAVARGHFKAGRLKDGLAVLEDILKTPKDDAARKAAGDLKTEWTKARAASEVTGAGYAPITKYRELFPVPKVADLPDKADWDTLGLFRKRELAERIKAAVPGLDDKTDWNELAAACQEADLTPWVKACLTECWVEMTLGKKKPDFTAPNLDGADIDGYARYVTVVRSLVAPLDKADPRSEADEATRLVNDELVAKHDWATAFRFGRLAGLLADARIPYRAKDDAPVTDFASPYKKRDVNRVSKWLVVARKAADKAGLVTEVGEIDYELTLTEGCKDESDAKEFARAANATAAGEYLKQQDRLAQARFWVFHAKAQTDRKGELASLGKAFDLLQAPESAREARYVYEEVVWELRLEFNPEAGREKDKARPGADLLADMARKIVKNQSAWGKWKVTASATENMAPAKEAVELLLLAHEAKVKAGDAKVALEYADEAAMLADKHPDLPAATRGGAYGAVGWLRFDAGYKDQTVRKQDWQRGREPLAKALLLAPDHSKAWRWQFALGVATRFHWESRAKAAKAKGAELTNAEKLELANDHVRAANLVRTAEYQAYTAFNAPDPVEKAVAKAFYAERTDHYRGCKEVFDTAAKIPALADDPEAPLWRLAAAEMEFAIPAKPFMSAAQKKKADNLADEAEQSLDKIKSEQLRESAKTIIKRVREYKSE